VVEDGGCGRRRGLGYERIEGLELREEYGVKVGDKYRFGGSSRGREKDESEVECDGGDGLEVW
jgi:hypothetical protein